MEYLAALGAAEAVAEGDPRVRVPPLAASHWQQLNAAGSAGQARPQLDRRARARAGGAQPPSPCAAQRRVR